MQAIRTDFQPINRITTPLAGKPSFINSGIIKAVMKSGEKISVAQIDYQEFDEENFQYVISPYWDIVDGLPASVFQGIPGIDMDLRLKDYYRVNYVPTFIAERTPSESREDLWELLESVDLDYYDRFEWLLRTKMRAANDNLIVERRRIEETVEELVDGVISGLQYGDKLVANSIESMANSVAGLSDIMFNIVTRGIDVVTESGQVLVDATARSSMVTYMITQRIMSRRERTANHQAGIDQAKKEGKYVGRKPTPVDENVLCQVARELEDGIISVEYAMKRTKINSRSTFYRKVRGLKNTK
ncbi:MAG: recombinase family protein [Clostridia bacterium]|nr:recombinase family protein [Clostridia bacterium]